MVCQPFAMNLVQPEFCLYASVHCFIYVCLFFQRWLFQYLCGQNLVNERPPNGFRINVGNSMPRPVNGKTVPTSLRRNGLPKIIGKLCEKTTFFICCSAVFSIGKESPVKKLGKFVSWFDTQSD